MGCSTIEQWRVNDDYLLAKSCSQPSLLNPFILLVFLSLRSLDGGYGSIRVDLSLSYTRTQVSGHGQLLRVVTLLCPFFILPRLEWVTWFRRGVFTVSLLLFIIARLRRSQSSSWFLFGLVSRGLAELGKFLTFFGSRFIEDSHWLLATLDGQILALFEM